MDISQIIVEIYAKRTLLEPFIIPPFLNFMIIRCFYVTQIQLGIISQLENVYMEKQMLVLHGNINSYYLYQYSEQFWRKYQNNRKFSTIVINIGHEGTMEALKHYDQTIYNYLDSLFTDNLFKDTSIFLFSDHGVGIHSIYYILEFFKLEPLYSSSPIVTLTGFDKFILIS